MRTDLQTPLLSVIIPVFNSEKYLDRCIKSVLSQTYTNLEVILIDDGSTDESPAICDKYAQLDGRVRVIHQENRGIAVARNVGVEAATGELFAFVDSDDFIKPEMYEKLYDAMVETGAGLSECAYELYEDATGELRDTRKLEKVFAKRVITGTKALYELTLDDGGWLNVVPWNKLYTKKTVWKDMFPSVYAEDETTVHRSLYYAEKIAVIPDKLYYYVQRGLSESNSPFTAWKMTILYNYFDRMLFYHDLGLRELIRPGEQYPFLVITMGSATLDKSDPKNIAAVKKWRAEYREFYRKIKGDLSIITRLVRNLYFLLPGIVELFIKIINRLIFRGALTETINMNCTNLEDPILVALGKEKYCWNKDE